MSIYAPELEERLHRGEAVLELRRTNIFLRFLLGGFTLVITSATAGLVLFVFRPFHGVANALFNFAFAVATYVMAVRAIKIQRLYHHGIEEALGLATGGFLVAGTTQLWHMAVGSSYRLSFGLQSFVAGIAFAFIFKRFGWWYCAAISAVSFSLVPFALHYPVVMSRLTLAVVYLLVLVLVTLHEQRTVYQFEKKRAAIYQGGLMLAAYLAVNLMFPVGIFFHTTLGPSVPFRWATYALCWLIPLLYLGYGFKTKKRVFIDIGLLTFLISLITNKPYLEKTRYVWDPIPFGIFLMAVAGLTEFLLSNRGRATVWGLTKDPVKNPLPEGVELASAGVAAVGQLGHTQPAPGAAKHDLGGGSSGGGGASRGF